MRTSFQHAHRATFPYTLILQAFLFSIENPISKCRASICGSRTWMTILNSPQRLQGLSWRSGPVHAGDNLNGSRSSLNRLPFLLPGAPMSAFSKRYKNLFCWWFTCRDSSPLSYLTSTLNLNVLYLFFTSNHKPEANEWIWSKEINELDSFQNLIHFLWASWESRELTVSHQ